MHKDEDLQAFSIREINQRNNKLIDIFITGIKLARNKMSGFVLKHFSMRTLINYSNTKCRQPILKQFILVKMKQYLLEGEKSC